MTGKINISPRQIRLVPIAMSVLSALVCVAHQPAPAVAGNITYTWVEDDGAPVTGSLVVTDAALTAGEITLSNLVSFSWIDPIATYTAANISSLALDISPTTGGFTQLGVATFDAIASGSELIVEADHRWDVPGGQTFVEVTPFFTGTGHWEISGVSVPEPSTFTMALITIACGFGGALASRQFPISNVPFTR
jgi:hypothetical protein